MHNTILRYKVVELRNHKRTQLKTRVHRRDRINYNSLNGNSRK